MPKITLGRVEGRKTWPASDDQDSASFQFSFSNRLQAQLFSCASASAWEPSDIFLAVFLDLLRRYTGQNSVSVRTPHSVVSLAGNPSLRILIRQIQDQHSSPAPESGSIDGHFEPTQASLIRYDKRNWQRKTIEGFADAYCTLMQLALSQPDTPIADLDIIAPTEALQFAAWNQTARPYPSLRTDQLFDKQAAFTPHRPAVTFESHTRTYSQLSEEVNYLADRLRSVGVGPGTLVGICLERSHHMVVALLAVLKAGAAYLPLDPSFPADRLAFMQADARPLAVITQSSLLAKLPFTAPQILTLDPLRIHERRAAPPPLEFRDNLAYVLYTSGSTGKPKGVPITHSALTNLLVGVSADLSLNCADVLLATSTISFDISAFEIFAPLLCGAHLVVASRTVAVNGELLSEAIQSSGCTVLQATPSGWRTLLESGWTGQPGLKMLTAGEHLDQTLARKLLARGASLWNLYGPTEATIYATGQQITQAETRITIGKPLANYRTFVLDHKRQHVPVGAIGELYIGGLGVATGYLNRPELNAEKFVDGLFRTGDLARFLPDGQIDLLGRTDNQIKLRGCRIELEEIESVLDAHPAIRKAAVKIIDLNEGDQRLVAYISARYPDTPDAAELRDYAQRTLPPYMVPSAYISVDVLPLTPSGKIDRKALPNHLVAAGVPSNDPGMRVEQTVLTCWRNVLSAPDLDLDDNFFDMGGHSLLATRMSAELNKQLNCKIRPNCLIEAPTARSFAGRLLRMQSDAPAKCVVPMQTSGALPPLFFIHHLLGDIFVYRALAACFAPDRKVYGIQPPADFLQRVHPFSLVALAGEYVAEILEHQTEGPFNLVGYSSGSVLAFEIARQLRQAGHKVGLLALIDGEVNGPLLKLSKADKIWKTIQRKVCKVVFKFKDEFSDGLRAFVMNRVRHIQLHARVRSMQDAVTLEQALLLCENAYEPQPYSGSALLIRFHDEAWALGPNPLLGWGTLIEGGIEALDAPGGHITGMNPLAAPHLAQLLKARLQNIETTVAQGEPLEQFSLSR
jgi:amino acid adenylation domain-containing protein